MTSIAGAADEPGKLVFAQIMEHLPLTTFRRCVTRYDGEHPAAMDWKSRLGSSIPDADTLVFTALARFRCLRNLREGPAPRQAHHSNAYRSLGRALRLTRITAAPDVVASRDDASKNGFGADGCRDRLLHAELKLFAENPALRARAPRESCTGPIEAHGKQLFIAALEEVGMLGIVRCITHGCLFETSSGKCGSGSLAAGTGAAGAPLVGMSFPNPRVMPATTRVAHPPKTRTCGRSSRYFPSLPRRAAERMVGIAQCLQQYRALSVLVASRDVIGGLSDAWYFGFVLQARVRRVSIRPDRCGKK
jgi:hypothetical protein